MKYCLDRCYEEKIKFTPKERSALIGYCLSVGTRAKCSTRELLRPFRRKDLNLAFAARRAAYLAKIADYERMKGEYDPEKPRLSAEIVSFFEGIPSKENFSCYCDDRIRMFREMMRGMEREYQVFVRYRHIGKKLLCFHHSLNPSVTFGYSSMLHEECDFVLDDNMRAQFLTSTLAESPSSEGPLHDWGRVIFGKMQLIYEDLCVYRGDMRILETITHEECMSVWLEKDDLDALAANKGGKALVNKLERLPR